MAASHVIKLIDTHAGGDVSRIVVDGVGDLPGKTVRAQMEYLRDHADGLRKLLLYEPFGIPEMSIDLVVPACDPKAEYGYIIMEVMGYPIYSGSNTICTATALLESGMIPMQEGEQHFTLESPAGLVDVMAHNKNGRVESVTIQGLPSYIEELDAHIDVPGLGKVQYSIAYSGGFYALVDAESLGFKLIREEEIQLAAVANKIVEAIREHKSYYHPELGDVGPLPFLHFMGPLQNISEQHWRSASATYVHPNVICRSTTGTGTAARLSYHYAKGELTVGDALETVSLRSTTFVGYFQGEVKVGNRKAVASTITGKAYTLARSDIVIDPSDGIVDLSEVNLPPFA
ncbi:proline racemase family protein [Bermanella sp. R86510]|uniref:proline racemase family protein n=1 Tax=unclassified Bermanella TaxID=2627862 RepID=UPI0037C81483